MQEIKYCQRCGKLISDVNASDWYSHISKKNIAKFAAVNQIEKKQRLELQRCGRGKSKKINTEMNN